MSTSNSERNPQSAKNIEKPSNTADILSGDCHVDGSKTPKADEWSKDKWKEDIEKHPLFMTETPDSSNESTALVEGLQLLELYEDEKTPDELARICNENGHFYVKCKKHEKAMSHYSRGIKLNCSVELKIQLFYNRSTIGWLLHNFESAINDCEEILKLDPTHEKAYLRKVWCLYRLENYEKCMEICDNMCQGKNPNREFKNIKSYCESALWIKDRIEERRRERNERKKQIEEELILEDIESRKIKIRLAGNKEFTGLSDLEPESFSSVKLDRVHLREDRLFWPVLYDFPELSVKIPINGFDEDQTFEELLNSVSERMTEHDPEKKFFPDNVRIFFLDEDMKLVEFHINRTLLSITSDDKFVLSGGIILFTLLLKDTDFTTEYLSRSETSSILN